MTRALARLPFAVHLALRSNRFQQGSLSLLTVMGIATAVALATGLQLSARSVEIELARTADSLAGSAEAEVTGGAFGVREDLLKVVGGTEGVAMASPFVQASLRLASGPATGQALYVIGVDLLADQEVRTYPVEESAVQQKDPLAMLADVRSVAVSRSFAENAGLRIGDEMRVARGSREFVMVIRGLLESGGVADAFGGNVAVMDVYSLQNLLQRRGWLDRIDVVVSDGAALETVLGRLRDRLAGRATVRRAAARDEWVDYTLATMTTVVWSIVLVGVIVASLLVLGVISLSVERRAREFALLRAVGLEGNRTRRLLRVEALLMAAVGSAIGLPAGIALARLFLPLLSSISVYLQDVEIQKVDANPGTYLLAVGVGIGVAVAGSLGPSRRLSAQGPLEVLRGAAASPPERRAPRPLAVACWLVVLAVWVGLGVTAAGLAPLVRVGLIAGLGILMVGTATLGLLPQGFRWQRRTLERWFPSIGRLFGASLAGRARHTAITVASVAAVLAGVSGTEILVDSLSRTLDDWIATEYRDAILVTAGSPFSGRDRELVSHETTSAIRAAEGVRAVSELFTGNILYKGVEVLLVGQTMSVLERYGHLPAIRAEPNELAHALAEGRIAVSDAFSDHFGVGVGDALTLETPRGPQTFEVAGLFRDYVGPAGSVQLDIGVLDRYWPREGSYLLAVWPDGAPEIAIEAARRSARGGQDLYFIHGQSLDRYASSVMRRFTSLLGLVALLTAILGGIAVMNLLMGSVAVRRRELALLRTAGATNGQLAAMILLDGGFVALLGAAAGVPLGALCAYPMVKDVLREAFGWSVVYVVDPWQMVWILAGVVAAATLASLYPALQATRIVPRDIFAPAS